jgi:hypothetical protein
MTLRGASTAMSLLAHFKSMASRQGFECIDEFGRGTSGFPGTGEQA